MFGIFALYSISIYESFDQTLRRAQVGKRSGDPSNFFYFNKQLVNIIKALVVVGIAYFIPIKRIKDQRVIYVIGIGAVVLQLLVFTPIGIDLNGARGWLYIPGLGNMQPAEFFKIGFVIFFSGWLIRKAHFFRDTSLYIAMAVMLGLIGLLFLAIPDLGSMLVIAIVAVIMAIYAGAKFKYLLMIA
ncbi:MAG: FtsW/RodA/SpoVE family cell cycle protein [Candidatus Peribacteria bacterium]|nr:MAG: FtsW/RodA/SpoVE family cell cycle protein [Candidatus Peribacteria bacterium]